MAGTITSLQIQKGNKERVNVFLDESYAFAVTLTVALELKKGQFLTDAEIERFKADDNQTKAYDRAIFFLGFRARSQVEVEKYLRKKEYPGLVIEATVARLKAEQYLDDEQFAQAWIENRERLKPKSKRALRYELRQKGLAEDAINQALTDLDESMSAERALENKVYQWQHLEEADFRKKAMGFLSRRGFGYEVSAATVDQAWESIESPPE